MLLESLFYAFAIAIFGVFVWTAALIAAFWAYNKIRKKGNEEAPAIRSLSD